jgi:hypothetical protein
MKKFAVVSLLVVAGALVACEKKPNGGGGSASAPGTPQKASWRLTSMPADAVEIAGAKSSAKAGDQIALHGRIGGRKDPMSKDSAIFVMMDAGVPSCADAEGDTCETPWDYCCETPDMLAANNATVQLVDDSGNPLEIDLSSYGFEPLDEVVVVGTVAPRPTEQVLTIKASGLYRVGG